jgi:hypothetical protein
MPHLDNNGYENEKGSVHVEERAAHQPIPQSPPIQLSQAQYERLFFQPGGGPRAGDLSNPRQLGNPTALAIVSYLLALTPTVCILIGLDGTAPSSLTGIMGVFYFIGGMGMTIGGVFEWVRVRRHHPTSSDSPMSRLWATRSHSVRWQPITEHR